MTPPPALLHVLGQAARTRHALAFAHAADEPGLAQWSRLRSILRANAGTEYGRRYGFADIDSPARYAQRVPLVTPAEVAPFVDRMMAGERGVLTAEAPVYYCRTTGSTGRPKHVPITPAYRAEFQKTVYVALWHLYNRFPAAFFGRALYFVGTRREAVAADGCDIGTMSGFNFNALPPLLRAVYAWPYELFEVADLATRSYLALALACVSNVSLVAGIFPAPIVYLLRDLEARAEFLADHLARGALPADLVLTPTQRVFFEARLPANAAVARRLRAAARGPRGSLVSTAWPGLRLVYCWNTATAGLFIPELKERLGPEVAVRDAIFSACEGWCTIPMGDEETGGPLAVDVHHFEFIPEADYLAGRRETLPVEALRDGERYFLVVTQSGGLYRYDLGDLLEVSGFWRNTPRLQFVRKAGAFSNLVGEKLDEGHVNAAMATLGLNATWFALVPCPGARPAYALHLELSAGAASPGDAALAASLETALSRECHDFGRYRASGALGATSIRRLPAGTYDRHRQRRVAAGAAEAQLKTAHLVADLAELPVELRGGGG